VIVVVVVVVGAIALGSVSAKVSFAHLLWKGGTAVVNCRRDRKIEKKAFITNAFWRVKIEMDKLREKAGLR